MFGVEPGSAAVPRNASCLHTSRPNSAHPARSRAAYSERRAGRSLCSVQRLTPGFDAGNGTRTTGDVNGDGKTDLIYVHPSDDTIWTFLLQGNGQYQRVGYSISSGFDASNGSWL